MTREEIEQMPAGPEMDYAVLTAIGWETHFDSDTDSQVLYKRDNAFLWAGGFEPSKDLNAAMAVVEYLDNVTIMREESQWSVGVVVSVYGQSWVNNKRLPLAICRAALIATLPATPGSPTTPAPDAQP